MPDQSSAATEHSIIQEITAPLSTLPDDPVPIAAAVDFPIVLRGYDRVAVNAYIKKTSQLVAELQATRSPEAAIRRALERVGEEISGVLQRAHETAGEVTAQSRREAEERLERAREEAAQITAEAKARLRELDADTDRIWAERHRIVDDARDLARQLIGLADAATDRFPPAEEPAAAALVGPGPFDVEAAPEQVSGDPASPTDLPEESSAGPFGQPQAEAAASSDPPHTGQSTGQQELPEPDDERAETWIMPPPRPPDDPGAGQ